MNKDNPNAEKKFQEIQKAYEASVFLVIVNQSMGCIAHILNYETLLTMN